jgi:heme exporter protein D
MPVLGDYTFAVLGSYAAAAVLLGGLVLLSVWRARRVKAALDRAEARRG